MQFFVTGVKLHTDATLSRTGYVYLYHARLNLITDSVADGAIVYTRTISSMLFSVYFFHIIIISNFERIECSGAENIETCVKILGTIEVC